MSPCHRLTIISLDMSEAVPTIGACLHAQAGARVTPTNSRNISSTPRSGKRRTIQPRSKKSRCRGFGKAGRQQRWKSPCCETVSRTTQNDSCQCGKGAVEAWFAVTDGATSLAEVALGVSKAYSADIYLYSGPIDDRGYGRVAVEIAKTKQQAANELITGYNVALLILTTTGGQANAAYQIARLFQTQYDQFIIFTPSYCKSAGTIVALGAHKLLMDVFSKLGPLDVQIPKENEIFARRSGLISRSAFESLQEVAFDLFEHMLINITLRSQGLVGFKVASEISAT